MPRVQQLKKYTIGEPIFMLIMMSSMWICGAAYVLMGFIAAETDVLTTMMMGIILSSIMAFTIVKAFIMIRDTKRRYPEVN